MAGNRHWRTARGIPQQLSEPQFQQVTGLTSLDEAVAQRFQAEQGFHHVETDNSWSPGHPEFVSSQQICGQGVDRGQRGYPASATVEHSSGQATW